MAGGIDKNKYEVDFIFLNPKVPEIYHRLKKNNVNTVFYNYNGKKDLLKVFLKLLFYFLKHRPEIIHAHLFDASLTSLPAAWLARVKKRIHTRHHGSIHHDSHQQAVKYDRFINYLSTDIIAVSERVKSILIDKDKADSRKIVVLHHGFDFSMTEVNFDAVIAMKQKYDLESSYPVIGVISRFVEWKGVQFIIPAFKKLLHDYPDAKLVLANANGDYKTSLLKMLADIPQESYLLVNFEKEVYTLFKCFDFFIHVPVSPEAEAFGQIYIEALACKIPMICTVSGIATEFIRDHENAVVVDYANTDDIYKKLKLVMIDEKLKKHIIEEGFKSVIDAFGMKKMILKLEAAYG